MIKKSKKKSWIEFVQKMKHGTHPAVIYETMRKIKRRLPKKISILSENDQIYATVSEVAEKFVKTFQQVSTNDNYGHEFLIHKNATEQGTICFDSHNAEPYNRPFTVEELEFNLSRTKNTIPGNDGVHYQMLKKMPLEAKQYICNILNKLWQLYFPSQWTTAIIVPIHKPGKNHSNSFNYRPIALTSYIFKLLKRTINERLMDYMEMNKLFSSTQ